MTQQFGGKVALITGSGGGQGRAAALRFAAAGAHVIGCDVKVEGNRETAELVKAVGGSITTMEPIDLGDSNAAKKWVDEAAAVKGRIDVVYNNASATRFGLVDELSVEDWDFSIRNELDLIFYVTKAAWPWLKKRGGVVLNTGSVSGMGGDFAQVAHAATKGGVIAMTRALAAEGAPHGIRVIAISPGAIATEGTKPLFDANPEMMEAALGRSMIKRIGVPDDIAAVALFLASDEASFITGTNIVVDGGRTSS